MKTKERLAQVLEQEGLRLLADKARRGYYDDFESPLATPAMELVKDLQLAGRQDLAALAIKGEWDSTKEEAEAWARSAEGAEVMKSLTERN